jgi:23S rRNA (guanosine2251-2'-O)-methyltransferase
MAEGRDRMGNKTRNDNKIGPKFHFGKKPAYGGDNKAARAAGDWKPSGDNRGPRSEGDRKPYGDNRGPRSEGDRKPYGDNRGPRSDGDRKPYGDNRGQRSDGDRKPYGDNRGQRSDSDRNPYGNRGQRSDSERNPYGNRGQRSDSDRKPYGDRGQRSDSDRKPYSDRGQRSDSDRKPYGDSRLQKSDSDRKPYGDSRFQKSDADKRSPYAGGPKFDSKLDVETKDEFVGEIDKLEGRNPIMEALKANRTINKIFVAKGEREGSIRQIIAMAREKKIIITEVEHNALESMSSTKSHQGIIAFVAVKEYVEVDEILKIAEEKGQPPFIIILDEITDPHNFGAILRTANAVGAHGVIIPKRRAIGLTSAVSKASAGAIEYVPVARVTNISQTIESLKKKNVWIVGTDATGEKAFYESDLKGPMALVVGSEGEGISKLIREKCDFVVNIPMQGEISSLNASVAAAIVMYEILKQRGKV